MGTFESLYGKYKEYMSEVLYVEDTDEVRELKTKLDVLSYHYSQNKITHEDYLLDAIVICRRILATEQTDEAP